MLVEMDRDGVAIRGDAEELEALAETLMEAVASGRAEGRLLTEDGVENFVVEREDVHALD